MKAAYTVAKVRERLAEALDEAERGTPVVIERRGVRYRLVVEPAPKRPRRAAPLLEVVDASLLERGWTWELGPDGQLGLAAPPTRSRSERAPRPRAPRRRR